MTTFNLSLPEIDKKTPLPEEVKEESIQTQEPQEDEKEKSTIPELSTSPVDKKEELRKKKVVVMDGPLSKIYTEALNIVFNKDPKTLISNESNSIDVTLASKYNSAEQEGSDIPNSALYVYVLDEKGLKSNQKGSYSNISKLMKKHSNNPLYVSIESNSILSDETVSFMNFCREKGCKKIFTNRRNCLEYIKDYLSE